MCTMMSGRAVYPTNFGVPTLEDIALSLSRMPRFAGHTRQPWSVLQHIALCDELASYYYEEVQKRNARGAALARLAVLLHDAEESVLGDMPSTWKRAVPEVKALYELLQARIYISYLGRTPPDWAEELVSEVDTRALYGEMLEFAAYECWIHSGAECHGLKEVYDDERVLAQKVASRDPVSLRKWFVDTVTASLAVWEAEDESGSKHAGRTSTRSGKPEGGVAPVVGIVVGGNGEAGGSAPN